MSASVTVSADPSMTAIREISHDSIPAFEGPERKVVKVRTKVIKVPKAQDCEIVVSVKT